MLENLWIFQLILISISICGTRQAILPKLPEDKVSSLDIFVYWPNATIPFFINPNHFDHEQALAIMSSLSMFTFKTCLKFMPVMAAPQEGQHVMTFVNPDGVKRCRLSAGKHSNYGPHIVQLGYECLKSPEIDMIVMRALGLPFEHNRMSRDIFINVAFENIEPRYAGLFAKNGILPRELQAIPYDINSVMHFGERDYSKNGHRTIIFRFPNMRQQKNGLSPSDIKKIELIYGPHCRARDRSEKYTICQAYPGLTRRKRQITEIKEPLGNISLRVNPNITPPPEIFAGITKNNNNGTSQPLPKAVAEHGSTENVTENLNTLNITKETDKIVELINELFTLVLKEAREKFCNKTVTGNVTSEIDFKYDNASASDVLSMLKSVTRFSNKIFEDVVKKPTEFCLNAKSLEVFQSQCKQNNDTRCSFSSESGKVTNATENIDANKQMNDDKKTTTDKNIGTSSKLDRRKREATIDTTTLKSSEAKTESMTSVSTASPSEAINEVKTTTRTPESLEDVKSDTTLITPNSLAVGNKSSSDTAPSAEAVLRASSASKALPEDSKLSTYTAPKTKPVMRSVNAPKSSEAVNKVSANVNTPKVKRTESNLKETIKAMRAERLQEIKNTNFTEPLELLSKKNSKLKANKTIPSRSKLKSLRKEKKKRANSTAKQEVKTDSRLKKDIVDSPRSRVDTRRKKSRLIEIQRATKFPKIKEDREVFRRVSMENRGRTTDDSSESDESAISIEVQKEPTSVKVHIVTDSKERNKKYIEDSSEESSRESKELKKEKSKTHTKGKHKKVDDLDSKHKKIDESELKHKKVEESELKHKKIEESSSTESSSDEIEENLQKKVPLKNLIELPETVELSKLNKEFYAERIWPDGEVIYVIKKLPDYGEKELNGLRERLAAVNKILTNRTCVRIREVEPEEAEGFEDYLVIDNSPDFVRGRVGGKQIFGAVELFKVPQPRQLTAMMVMSMLGFYFEVSRHDRDAYIRVHNRHIRPDKLHHFEKLREEATLDLPYDYYSATHPSMRFWSKLGIYRSSLATYRRRDPRGLIMRGLGNNVRILSETDIIKINSVYGIKCFLEPEPRPNKNKKYRSRSENVSKVIQ